MLGLKFSPAAEALARALQGDKAPILTNMKARRDARSIPATGRGTGGADLTPRNLVGTLATLHLAERAGLAASLWEEYAPLWGCRRHPTLPMADYSSDREQRLSGLKKELAEISAFIDPNWFADSFDVAFERIIEAEVKEKNLTRFTQASGYPQDRNYLFLTFSRKGAPEIRLLFRYYDVTGTMKHAHVQFGGDGYIYKNRAYRDSRTEISFTCRDDVLRDLAKFFENPALLGEVDDE